MMIKGAQVTISFSLNDQQMKEGKGSSNVYVFGNNQNKLNDFFQGAYFQTNVHFACAVIYFLFL